MKKELCATGASRYEEVCDCGIPVVVFVPPSECEMTIVIPCSGCQNGIEFEIGGDTEK